MPLNQARLAGKIKDLVESNEGGESGIEYFSQNLASLLIEELKLADVFIDPGISVSVMPVSGIGATTSIGKGKIQ